MADQAVASTVAPPGDAAGRRPGWPVGLFRAVATLYALATVLQPFLAGMFLSGSFGALKAHELTGQAVGGLGILTFVCAVLLWRVRGGSALPVRFAGGLLVATVLQIVIGYSRILVLHVPLGVAMVFGVGRLAVFAWREAGK